MFSADKKRDQFQKLGIPDPDSPVTAPPPTYPPRPGKFYDIPDNEYLDYTIIWAGNFQNFLRNSPYKMSSKKEQEELPSMKDCINADGTRPKKVLVAEYRWDRLPKELYCIYNKKKDLVRPKKRLKRAVEIKAEQKLEILEKKEKLEGLSPKHEIKSDSENEHEEEEGAREDDENDDAEFDYGNNYFDNGEDFGNGDDDDDDGPLF